MMHPNKLSSMSKQAVNEILQAKFTTATGKQMESSLITHAAGKKHKLVLERRTSASYISKPVNLSGSRGYKNSRNVSILQSRIDEIKNQAIIGLEYVIEVNFALNFECEYHCVLCKGKYDFTTVVSHLTAYNHRWKYLEKHFPTAFKEISDLESTDKRELKVCLTEKVCEEIEDQFGRLPLLAVGYLEFIKDRMQVTEKAVNAKHINEYMGCTFRDLIRGIVDKKEQNLSDFSNFDAEDLQTRRVSLQAISTSSESYSVISLSSSSRSMGQQSPISGSKNRKTAALQSLNPYNSETIISTSERVQHHAYKMEKFKLQMNKAETELKKKYEDYKDKPLTHSGYKAKWDLFWKRRYKELKSEGRSTDKHDFKSEWLIEWNQLMEAQLRRAIESKRIEICRKLEILSPESTKEKTQKTKFEKSADMYGTSFSRKANERRSTKDCESPKRQKTRSHRSRSPQKSTRRRSPSPTRTHRQSQPPHRKSRTPLRDNGTRLFHSSPKCLETDKATSYGRSRSPKQSAMTKSVPTGDTVHHWTRTRQESASPELSKKAVTSSRVPIQSRRYTSFYPKPTVQEQEKLCAHVRPRLKSGALFETTKEKLKGLISANLVEPDKVNAVKKTIKNMAFLVHQTNERQKTREKLQEIGSKKPFVRTETQQDTSSQRLKKAPPSPAVSSVCEPQNTPPVVTVSEEARKAIKARLSEALAAKGKTDTTDTQLEDLAEAYLREVEQKKALEEDKNRSISQQESMEVMSHPSIENSATTSHVVTGSDTQHEQHKMPSSTGHSAKSASLNPALSATPMMSTNQIQNRPIEQSNINPAPQSTNENAPNAKRRKIPAQNVSIAKSSRIQKIRPPAPTMRTMDGDTVTLSDAELKILMRKFDALSDNEKKTYLTFMNALKVSDPQRYQRLNDGNEHSTGKTNRSTDQCDKKFQSLSNANSKELNANGSSSDTIYSSRWPNEDVAKKTDGSICINGSDSDSDDFAMLVSSIAETQQQIAELRKNLNPIDTDRQIPVISSVQRPGSHANVPTILQQNFPPNLPPVNYHGHQLQYQHRFFQPYQQPPYQQQYQQYHSPQVETQFRPHDQPPHLRPEYYRPRF